jgi:hypothetical protein
MSYQTKSWERDRPPVFTPKAHLYGAVPGTITPPRYMVGSRVETDEEFDEMKEWLEANCRWTFRVIGKPWPPMGPLINYGALLRHALRVASSIAVSDAVNGTKTEIPPNIVSVEFRRKEDATLFKMFWGAEG